LSRLKDLFDFNNEEMWIVGQKDKNFARARSVKKAVNLQGMHAVHLLWLCDESFGIVDPEIWEMIEGSMTWDDNYIVFGGQHSVVVGYCHDAFHKDRDAWKRFRFNAEKSPIAKPEYAARIARKYGKNSDVYRIRVRGAEPRGNPQAFIQLGMAEAARKRHVEPKGIIRMGVDPARFGDDLCVVTAACGNHIFPQAHLPQSDTDDMYELVIQELRKYRALTGYKGPVDIKVDNSGGWGAGLVDALNKNRSDNIHVVPIVFDAGGDEEYSDKISIMYGETKEQLPYLEIEDNDDVEFLLEELGTRRYKYDGKGRVQIEPKDKYKKDYEGSPDRSDSFVLCLSKRTEAVRVLAQYLSTNPEQHRNFKIAWEQVKPEEVLTYVVIIVEKNLGIFGGCYLWGRQSRVLHVYAEFIHVNPVPVRVAHDIKKKAVARLGKSKRFENIPAVDYIFANDEYFKGGKDMARVMRKQGVRAHSSKYYDEAGGVALMNGLLTRNMVVVHDEACPEHDLQMRKWEIQNKKPVKGYPLCQAVVTVACELRERGELREPEFLKPYGKKKQVIHRRMYETKGRSLVRTSKSRRTMDDYLVR
jgi:hypothetical protein